jgi:hypothetical protein
LIRSGSLWTDFEFDLVTVNIVVGKEEREGEQSEKISLHYPSLHSIGPALRTGWLPIGANTAVKSQKLEARLLHFCY